MISPAQKTDIFTYLDNTNLPLDLKVEISDHFIEQVNNKTDCKNMEFDAAFNEVKMSWKEDLRLKANFFGEAKTKIFRDTSRRTSSEILKKALMYFLVYFVLNIGLILINRNLASAFIFGFCSILLLVFLFLFIKNNKIFNSASQFKKLKISYLQPKVYFMIFASIFIFFQILFNYEENFNKYYTSVVNLFVNHKFNIMTFGLMGIFNLYAFCWIFGFLYFLRYKKSIEILEQKINFKL